jgi:signal transduction histidine kinase
LIEVSVSFSVFDIAVTKIMYLSNAVKFSQNSGMIYISVLNEGSCTKIALQDNGIGISEADAGKLFRADTHYSLEGTAGETGTGLWLILCKEYVEKNNGKIWVESIEGQGSTFFFTVPLATNFSAKARAYTQYREP